MQSDKAKYFYKIAQNILYIFTSDQMAMTQLMLFVTGGEFDVKNCRFKVQQRENKENKRFRKRDENKIVEVNSVQKYFIFNQINSNFLCYSIYI